MDATVVERRIRCPYCGEALEILLDLSAGDQSYIEDCQVCCQPISISYRTTEDDLTEVMADRAN